MRILNQNVIREIEHQIWLLNWRYDLEFLDGWESVFMSFRHWRKAMFNNWSVPGTRALFQTLGRGTRYYGEF
jgi:hypothetical protein